eukprot:630800-Prymnesium_polylepis.1
MFRAAVGAPTWPKRRADLVSCASDLAGEQQTMIVVRQLPPNDSCSSLVRAELRKGMWPFLPPLLADWASKLMTLPRASRLHAGETRAGDRQATDRQATDSQATDSQAIDRRQTGDRQAMHTGDAQAIHGRYTGGGRRALFTHAVRATAGRRCEVAGRGSRDGRSGVRSCGWRVREPTTPESATHALLSTHTWS